MGSTSMNPDVSDLLQSLSSLNSPVLSSPAVTSALEKAPASDIVQLSSDVTQLEGVEALFGIQPGTNDSPDALTSELTNLANTAGASGSATASTGSPAGSASASSSSTSSTAASESAQLATYQAAVQSEEVQGLLTPGTLTGTGSLFNLSG
jgi:hypothetical protein